MYFFLLQLDLLISRRVPVFHNSVKILLISIYRKKTSDYPYCSFGGIYFFFRDHEFSFYTTNKLALVFVYKGSRWFYPSFFIVSHEAFLWSTIPHAFWSLLRVAWRRRCPAFWPLLIIGHQSVCISVCLHNVFIGIFSLYLVHVITGRPFEKYVKMTTS